MQNPAKKEDGDVPIDKKNPVGMLCMLQFHHEREISNVTVAYVTHSISPWPGSGSLTAVYRAR